MIQGHTLSEKGVSVVVPVYNSEGSLEQLIARLEPVLIQEAESFEAILVNDDSRDKSWAVIERICTSTPWVRGIQLMRNHGQHNALLCGIREARYDRIITVDDDLQNPPEEIPLLLAALDSDFDVVYGAPKQPQHGFVRNFASNITKVVLQQTMGATTARNVSAFRAFRTNLRNAFHDYRSPYVSIDVLLTWATTRFTAIKVRHEPRQIGKSNYTIGRLTAHAINMVTGFSILPLQMASILGFTFAVFGALILTFVLVRWIVTGSQVPGFAFIASSIAIFSGVQLFALGILGEYLARIHLRIMGRPAYTVRSWTAASKS